MIGRSAVAVAVVAGALFSAGLAVADETSPPSPTAPASTTTDAPPPPDPYKAPVRTSKPKPAPSHAVHVVRSAPVASTGTYSRPPVSTVEPRPSTRRPHRPAKPTHKPRRHVIHQRRNAKPANVQLVVAPVKEVLAAARIPLPPVAENGRERYLWLSGVALALFAVAALSLHFLSARFFRLGVGGR